MTNNFSLLGIGACGGNQVYAFRKYGLESFYINSAIEDLKSLGIDDINYYHIKNATGCHKDRNVSKQYLAHNFEEILAQVDRYLTGKYVFLFGSTGGGTSSGMVALMTELIENELDKIVIPVVTLPHFSESLQAKTNSYETLKELFETAKHTVFIVDNNKETNYMKSNEILANNISKSELAKKAGVSRNSIIKMANGEIVHMNIIAAICEACELELIDVVEFKKVKKGTTR